MILHVLDALAELSVQKVVVVVGHRGEWVTKTLIDHAPLVVVHRLRGADRNSSEPAMLWPSGSPACPTSLVDADGDVVVLPGDTPLVRPPTLAALVRHHRDTGAAATLLTAVLARPDRATTVSCGARTMPWCGWWTAPRSREDS